MKELHWRFRGENKTRFIAGQGGAPATEANVGPSDKLEVGRLTRLVCEQLRREEEVEPDWGVLGMGKDGWKEGEGLCGESLSEEGEGGGVNWAFLFQVISSTRDPEH